jgi:hypothetical protein
MILNIGLKIGVSTFPRWNPADANGLEDEVARVLRPPSPAAALGNPAKGAVTLCKTMTQKISGQYSQSWQNARAI